MFTRYQVRQENNRLSLVVFKDEYSVGGSWGQLHHPDGSGRALEGHELDVALDVVTAMAQAYKWPAGRCQLRQGDLKSPTGGAIWYPLRDITP